METEGVVSFKNRIIRVLVLLAALAGLLIFQKQLVPLLRVRAASDACTYIIPNDVEKVDGLGNYSQVIPGDVLCLPAGNRGNIRFLNLNGADGNPITIRNEGGKVTIFGEKLLTGGIGLINSSNIHLTGAGVASQCGAPYASDNQACGIELGYVHRGIRIDTKLGTPRNIEIDHIYIHHTSEISETMGISLNPVEYQMVSGINLHHNHISRTSSEGFDLGSEPGVQPYEVQGKLENVEVSYNLVEDTGFDGIKIKVAVQNVKVHHNVIRNAGIKHKKAQQGAITLESSVGDYFNNLIINGCEGIRTVGALVNPGTRYFNNVVIGTKCGGIEVGEVNAQVFNNTLVRTAPFGIHVEDPTAMVYNNIVAETLGTPIEATGTGVFSNFVGPAADVGFVNYAASDFHLLPSSPAVDAADPTNIYPPDDYDGTPRPYGSTADLGAFEYDPSVTPGPIISGDRVLIPIILYP